MDGCLQNKDSAAAAKEEPGSILNWAVAFMAPWGCSAEAANNLPERSNQCSWHFSLAIFSFGGSLNPCIQQEDNGIISLGWGIFLPNSNTLFAIQVEFSN